VTGYLRLDIVDRSSNERSATVASTMNFAIITRWSGHGKAGQGSGMGKVKSSTSPPPDGTATFRCDDTTGAAWPAPGSPRRLPSRTAVPRRTARLPFEWETVDVPRRYETGHMVFLLY
jgi:hypothetical protein